VEAIYDCGSSFETISVEGRPSMPVVSPADLCLGTPTVYFASATGATSFTWVPTGNILGSDLCLNASCSQFYIEWDYFGATMDVIANNNCGSSDPFNSWNYCRLAESGLNAEVYPNPTSGLATVEFGAAGEANYSIKISDLAGRVMITKEVAAVKGINQVEIDLSGAAKGMYLVNISGADGVKVTKRLAVE
jgi:Secretion system C-terminal sorting domain